MAEKKKATTKAAAPKAEAKKAPEKKAAPKKEAKEVKKPAKAPAKEVKEEKKPAKASSKPAPKAASKKTEEPKAETSTAKDTKKPAKGSTAKVEPKAEAKVATKASNKKDAKKSDDTKSVKDSSPKPNKKDDEVVEAPVEVAAKPETKKSIKKPTVAPAPVVEPEPVAEAVETVAVVEIDAEQYSPVLLRGIKKLRSVFFQEVNEQEERANKKKVSSDVKAAEKPTLALRHKASLAEETPEELHARVIRELEEANRIFEAEIANQVCTRCCINPVVAEFRVDKDLGYCEECAAILKLGQSKEARQTEYNMNFARGEDDEDEDEDFEDGPTAEDLEEAEEDLED